jgi:hypothetical protein
MSGAEDREREEGAEARRVEPPGSPVARSEEEEAFDEELDEVDLREIMRQVMDRPPKGAPPNILGGVQRKLRSRSRGKFYGDGWSTARTPRSTYLITSLFMLALIAFVFLVLIPWGGGALPLP